MKKKDLKLIQAAIDHQLDQKQLKEFDQRLKNDVEFNQEYEKWLLSKRILSLTTQAKAPRNFTITQLEALELNQFKTFFFARLSKTISYVAMVLFVGLFIVQMPSYYLSDSAAPMMKSSQGIQENTISEESIEILSDQASDFENIIPANPEIDNNNFGAGSGNNEDDNTSISNSKRSDEQIQQDTFMQTENEGDWESENFESNQESKILHFYRTNRILILASLLLIISFVFMKIYKNLYN